MSYEIAVEEATGLTLVATIQRQSDGFYWSVTSQMYEASPAIVDKQIALTEGASENAGSYTASVTGLGDPGPVNVRLHNTALANQTIRVLQLAVEGSSQVYVSSLTRAGAESFTYTLTIDSVPLSNADVWVTTDTAGSNVIANGVTDSVGQVTFFLDPGTYQLWRQKSGFNFENPQVITVTAT